MNGNERILFSILVAETEIAWSTNDPIRDKAYNSLSGHAGEFLMDDSESIFVEAIVMSAEMMGDVIEEKIKMLRETRCLRDFGYEYKASVANQLIREFQVLHRDFCRIDVKILREIASQDWRERHCDEKLDQNLTSAM